MCIAIQKMLFFPPGTESGEVLRRLSKELPTDAGELFVRWPELHPRFTAERAALRDDRERWAYRIIAEIPQTLLTNALPNFSPGEARFVFLGSALEFGWEPVPRREDIAYLHGEYIDGDLHSVLKFDRGIRRYTMRNQLLPNINRRFTRFVVLYPDIIGYIAEANANFSRQCYVISRVVQRVAGRMDDVETLARLNGVELNELADYLQLMEKVAGGKIVLSHGTFALDPIEWPVE
ncbi:MAG: hypothetical protein D6681_10365 [Calditrichaeota bacterium]|nr:MAG: hypothetical protein D6681_10365 [Calditrichota bacterium]